MKTQLPDINVDEPVRVEFRVGLAAETKDGRVIVHDMTFARGQAREVPTHTLGSAFGRRFSVFGVLKGFAKLVTEIRYID